MGLGLMINVPQPPNVRKLGIVCSMILVIINPHDGRVRAVISLLRAVSK